MNNKKYLDDFEAFLSEAAEDHRMYPSDRVWRNIQKEIHGNTKWPALTFGAILTGAVILAGLIFIQPDKELFHFDSQSLRSKTISIETPVAKRDHEFADVVTIQAQRKTEKTENATSGVMMVVPDGQPSEDLRYFESPVETNANNISIDVNSKAVSTITAQSEFPNAGLIVTDIRLPDNQTQTLQLQDPMRFNSTNAEISAAMNAEQMAAELKPETNIQEQLAAETSSEVITSGLSSMEAPTLNAKTINWYTGLKKPSRWNMEYYVAPSLSNRVLLEDKSYDWHVVQNGPVAPNITYGVNRFVRHNAKLGLEAGASVMYSVSDRLRVKGGVQVNFRQYAIEGFRTNEREEATLRLMSDNPGGDIINTFASISSMLGELPTTVNNQYLQVGIPLGFDLRLADWNRVQFFVAATVQPTYQIAERSLLISSDYKHYVSQPDLLRKFNINSGLEAFLSFKSGGLNWQVGPQIRYQMLPGAIKEYPIREHLIDYGMKIGVVKQLR